MRGDTYRIFVHDEDDLWRDLGEFEGRWDSDAVEKAARMCGSGRYLVLSGYGNQEYAVSSRVEYDVERVEKLVPEAVGMSE